MLLIEKIIFGMFFVIYAKVNNSLLIKNYDLIICALSKRKYFYVTKFFKNEKNYLFISGCF